MKWKFGQSLVAVKEVTLNRKEKKYCITSEDGSEMEAVPRKGTWNKHGSSQTEVLHFALNFNGS